MIILKSYAEVQKLEVSSLIAAEILSELGSIIVPGIKTIDLEKLACLLFEKNQCKSAFKGYNGFPANICVSVNEVVVHGIPGDLVVREGDIVSIDVGVFKDGYYGDTAATFPVGTIKPETNKLLQTTQNALFTGIEKATVGNRLGDISNCIQETVEGDGFSIVRDFVGHGIGQSLHEDPQIPNFGKADTGPYLKHGMVLAIEPMVNQGKHKVVVDSDGWTVRAKDRLPSAHFEHTIAILNDGLKILSKL